MTAQALELVTCKATSKRSGKRCRKRPEPGMEVCRMHGGATPNAKAGAAVRLLQAKINGELQRRGWEPVTDPVTHYAQLGGEALAFKDLAREQVNALEDWSLTIGAMMRQDDEVPEYMAMAEQAKAVVGVYERALDRCDKILASMLRIGLTHEALRMAQERPSREQAETLAAVIGLVLSDPRVTVVEGQANAVVLDALKGLGS